MVGDKEITNYPTSGQLSAGELAYIWISAGTDTYDLGKTKPGAADVAADLPVSGTSVIVKIIDVTSQQLIADISVRG